MLRDLIIKDSMKGRIVMEDFFKSRKIRKEEKEKEKYYGRKVDLSHVSIFS